MQIYQVLVKANMKLPLIGIDNLAPTFKFLTARITDSQNILRVKPVRLFQWLLISIKLKLDWLAVRVKANC